MNFRTHLAALLVAGSALAAGSTLGLANSASAVVLPLSPDVPSAITAGTSTVFVPATQAWTDTGITLSQGETVRISASGRAQYSLTSPSVNPQGISFSNPNCAGVQYAGLSAIPFTAPGQRCYSLIGRLGDAPINFEVGSSFSWKAPQSGELYLGFNDSVYTDNIGGYTAAVTVN
jgi:hypothetical protein